MGTSLPTWHAGREMFSGYVICGFLICFKEFVKATGLQIQGYLGRDGTCRPTWYAGREMFSDYVNCGFLICFKEFVKAT